MKKFIILTIFLFINSIYAIGNLSVQDTISTSKPDTLIIQEQTKEQPIAEEKVKNTSLQEKINQLGAPPVNKIITTGKIVWSMIIILIGVLVIKIIELLLNRFGRKSAQYRIVVKRLIPIIKILGWTFVIYIIIQGVIRPPLATVIAFFTSIGVAIGFAAQDLLKNIFGGLMILFDRPFQIGDKIEAASAYGEVIKIGLRSTRIVTADDSVVTIPNGEMMNQSISNSNSGETNCQVVAEFFLPLDVDTQKVRRIALEAAMVSKYIYLNKPVAVLFFNEMKDRRSIIKMRLKAYVSDIQNEFIFKSDMTEITLRELIKEKVINKEYYQ
ncbi:mechanosensitive ion channel family protein [Saccharicrinis sp. GN24d3]|uniref:mechanosensitive ion channel family protein n=1 Tax=Saccharicrinis sp. GN24d3 TaxID=3458416 RepID=UPI0040372645